VFAGFPLVALSLAMSSCRSSYSTNEESPQMQQHRKWFVAAMWMVLSSLILPAWAQEAAPDFSLPDVNSTSATYGTDVSPRDHLGEVSGWYFGHGT